MGPSPIGLNTPVLLDPGVLVPGVPVIMPPGVELGMPPVPVPVGLQYKHHSIINVIIV